jgi:hypothetical protein
MTIYVEDPVNATSDVRGAPPGYNPLEYTIFPWTEYPKVGDDILKQKKCTENPLFGPSLAPLPSFVSLRRLLLLRRP